MKKILVTGSSGFIGKNLLSVLRTRKDVTVFTYDIENSESQLFEYLAEAEIVYHFAGINRPQNVEEFQSGNTGLTEKITAHLVSIKHSPVIVFTSSIQAALDNPYGVSKKRAEEALQVYAQTEKAPVLIFRLTNVFGKWCRPNYNSVVATFCHNIAHDLPVTISDPSKEMELVFVDDIVKAFVLLVDLSLQPGAIDKNITPTYRTTLGFLAATIQSFRTMRQTLQINNMSDRLVKALYTTYLSYLEKDDFSYTLTERIDDRGSLAEMYKSPTFGQVFVSRTKPGITRGNHYHHLKTEKFCVIEGEGIIRFRHIMSEEIISYPVSGKKVTIVDIPPGFTHSIENVGLTDMITIFWANEPFNPDEPDTYFESVLK